MKLTSQIVALGMFLLCIGAQGADSVPQPPATPFFKTTGEPFELEKPFPGITAALMLSEAQKTALKEAHQQTVRKPQLRQKISALEVKENPAEAEREVIRAEMAEARIELRRRVDAILKAEQKELVTKIQDAAIEAEHEANHIFDPEFKAAEGDEGKFRDVREKARVEAEDLLVQKIEKFLTPGQMQAVQLAATEQRAAQTRGGKRGK